MRRLGVLFAAFGVFSLFFVDTGWAKGGEPVRVVIRGPGLATPIVIRGDMGDPPGDRYWEFVGTAFPASISPAERPSSQTRLGPRFTAVYLDPCCGFHVRQYVYPFARGGPWTYTPGGQARQLFQMGMTDVVHRPTTGWYRAPALLAELAAMGLPNTDRGERRPSASPTPRNIAGWLAGAVALFIATSGLTAAILLRRRRVQRSSKVPASI